MYEYILYIHRWDLATLYDQQLFSKIIIDRKNKKIMKCQVSSVFLYGIYMWRQHFIHLFI